MIRKVGTGELALLIPLGEEWFSSSGILGKFNGQRFRTVWTEFLGKDNSVIFGFETDTGIHGVIGGIFYPDINTGEQTANEFFWYVSPSYRGAGIKLLKKFENWAKEHNCKKIRMTHLLEGKMDALEDLYRKRGYRAVEMTYEKGV